VFSSDEVSCDRAGCQADDTERDHHHAVHREELVRRALMLVDRCADVIRHAMEGTTDANVVLLRLRTAVDAND
jgi:hypothetical protein